MCIRDRIKDFTGVSSPYERPEKAELTINTDDNSIENCIEMILDYLKKKDIITKV